MAVMGSYLSFLCGCKGFGDLIVGSRIEVSGWLQNLGFFFFFFFKETQQYDNFLTPSRKMIETTLWWRKT